MCGGPVRWWAYLKGGRYDGYTVFHCRSGCPHEMLVGPPPDESRPSRETKRG